jgi:hypothetical protein
LTRSHTGKYLAQVIAACLAKYGLLEKLHTACMDNASNCNTTVDELEKLIPSFRGKLSRSRCFAHIINLIAKVRES